MFERNMHTMLVPVQQLTIGMYISDLDRPWLDTPFPIQGFEITSPDDIQLISDNCEFVYVDVKKSRLNTYQPDRHIAETDSSAKSLFTRPIKRSYQTPVATYREDQVYVNKHSVEEELENARKTYHNTKKTVNQILNSFKTGRDINISQAKEVINQCVESIFNNKDSLLWFTVIKNRDLYTSEHCLNVAILSIAFGRHLGHSEQTLKIIGLCGLLHDVGKINIPLEVLNKDGSFTQEEFEVMKQHPVFGRDYLLKQPNVPSEAIDATHYHHEKIDGSGYPEGLSGSQIPYYAKLVAITDAYDAITSERVYQHVRTTLQAQKILYEAAGSHFDEELVKAFIQWLGIYPPGSIVEMSNGEAGIVLSVNPNMKLKPRVLLLLDEEKNAQPQRIVDLYKIDLDRHGNVYKIKASHPNHSFGIDLRAFQQSSIIKNMKTEEANI
ncbi:HD-GYP domain-containing protein [Psychromonas sp.]|uniref:HD-GYP domain-containing protein n=1 Tax=Psychromonas sp. TaxID=1884585 RepID=UPI0035619DB2